MPSIAALSRLNSRLSVACLWLAGTGLVAMTVIVFAQVWFRYVLNDSLLWVEPVAILLMSYAGFRVWVYQSTEPAAQQLQTLSQELLKPAE